MTNNLSDQKTKVIVIDGTKIVVGTPEKIPNENRAFQELKISQHKAIKNKFFFSKILKITREEDYKKISKKMIKYENMYKNAQDYTIKQFAKITNYFKKMISNPKSFKLLLINHDCSFEKWFNIFVKFYLIDKITSYFRKVVIILSKTRKIIITQVWIKESTKNLYQFFIENYFDKFKDVLNKLWDKMYIKYIENNNKKNGPNFE